MHAKVVTLRHEAKSEFVAQQPVQMYSTERIILGVGTWHDQRQRQYTYVR